MGDGRVPHAPTADGSLSTVGVVAVRRVERSSWNPRRVTAVSAWEGTHFKWDDAEPGFSRFNGYAVPKIALIRANCRFR